MKVAALISGGKDSALALYRALQSGYDVKCLVTMIPQRPDSWMFHYPNIQLTELFAKASEIPLVKAETKGEKEKELSDLENLLRTVDVDGVVSGAISSQYQKTRVDEICRKLNLKSIAPLWHEDPLKLLNDIISLKFHAIIIGVYAHGLDQKWLGRNIDRETLNDLVELNTRFQTSIVGEGGEYETLVLDAPFFKKKIQIRKARIVWEGSSGYLSVEDAELQDKTH
jgi:ABC transporter with metal-binding/Fe-S-binding domain ATP-binding protein